LKVECSYFICLFYKISLLSIVNQDISPEVRILPEHDLLFISFIIAITTDVEDNEVMGIPISSSVISTARSDFACFTLVSWNLEL